MNKKDPIIPLDHILKSILLIERRIKNASHDRFINDIDLQDLIVHRFEIIGEAVRKLEKNFREQHPTIDWHSPARMRSALIHGYDDIDLDSVWDTVKDDLPLFKKQIKEIIKQIKTKA